MDKTPATDLDKREAEQVVGENSETNKKDKFVIEESRNKGPAAESTVSAEILIGKLQLVAYRGTRS